MFIILKKAYHLCYSWCYHKYHYTIYPWWRSYEWMGRICLPHPKFPGSSTIWFKGVDILTVRIYSIVGSAAHSFWYSNSACYWTLSFWFRSHNGYFGHNIVFSLCTWLSSRNHLSSLTMLTEWIGSAFLWDRKLWCVALVRTISDF